MLFIFATCNSFLLLFHYTFDKFFEFTFNILEEFLHAFDRKKLNFKISSQVSIFSSANFSLFLNLLHNFDFHLHNFLCREMIIWKTSKINQIKLNRSLSYSLCDKTLFYIHEQYRHNWKFKCFITIRILRQKTKTWWNVWSCKILQLFIFLIFLRRRQKLI